MCIERNSIGRSLMLLYCYNKFHKISDAKPKNIYKQVKDAVFSKKLNQLKSAIYCPKNHFRCKYSLFSSVG